MRNRERLSMPVPIGGSALLVIFAVLCLTTFAIMSLATAQADHRLAAASADAVRAYYRADTRAEEMLALLRGGEIPDGVMVSGENTYVYSVRISDTQRLQVKVRIDSGRDAVLEWKEIPSAQWTPDTALHVWDGKAVK